MKQNEIAERHTVPFGRTEVVFQLKRSKRRTLAITVKPDKSVIVVAPDAARLDTVKVRLRKRAMWIARQQEFFSKFEPRLPARRYVSGETHRYLGRQYRLKVLDGPSEAVKLSGRFLCVETSAKKNTTRVKSLVQKWFA